MPRPSLRMSRSSGAARRSRRSALASRLRRRSRRRRWRSSGCFDRSAKTVLRSSGSPLKPIWTGFHACRNSSADLTWKSGTDSPSRAKSPPLQRVFRGDPGWPGNVLSPDHNACVPGRIYAVANQKGGVGKTTTAVNLAACLAKAGERVLLVDLDPQANATSGLGEQANGTSSCDLLDGAPPGELAKPTRFENLDLIPSKPDLAGTAADLARRGDGERFLAETLAPAAETHAFVFVD